MFKCQASTRRTTSRGFTLVELLVVIAIIGILVALLLPAIQAAREAARRTQCATNLKNIGLALVNYTDVKKRLPAATQFRPNNKTGGKVPNGPGGTWVVEIWPFIEEQALYDQFDHNKPSDHVNNRKVIGAALPWLVCPSDNEKRSENGVDPPGMHNDGGSGVFNPTDDPVMGLWYPVSIGPTHMDACPFCPGARPNLCCQGDNFGGVKVSQDNDPVGAKGTFPSFAGLFGRYERGIKTSDITDGLTHTIMAGETLPYQCRYICAHCPNFPFAGTNIPLNTFLRFPDPSNPDCGSVGSGAHTIYDENPECGGYSQSCGYKSRHPGGAHLLMADGSVHFVNEAIDFRTFYLLGARKSGEVKSLQ